MSEILGIRSGAASPLPSPSPLGTPITSFDSEINPLDSANLDANKGELTTNAKLSVGDYFKQRMEEKRKGFEEAMRLAKEKAEGEGASSSSAGGNGLGVEEEIVVVGGEPAVSALATPAAAAAVEESEEEESDEEDEATPVVVAVVKEKKAKKEKRKRGEEGEGGEDASAE